MIFKLFIVLASLQIALNGWVLRDFSFLEVAFAVDKESAVLILHIKKIKICKIFLNFTLSEGPTSLRNSHFFW